MRTCLALIAILLALPAHAETLGVYGNLYPITEPDMIDQIKSKLQGVVDSGRWDRLMQEARDRVTKKMERPDPVESIGKVEKEGVRYYDPAVVVTEDLSDHQGTVFVKKGTVVSPLKYTSMASKLVFIDGDNQRQVEWAKEKLDADYTVKVVLVSGPPLELIRKWHRWVYFDQHGSLTRKMGIVRVPAMVSQEGEKLRIDEVFLE